MSKSRILSLALVCSALVLFGLGLKRALDPLDRLALKLNWISITGRPWKAGMCGMIEREETARPEDVLKVDMPRGAQVLELKRVIIFGPSPGDHHYWLARIDEGDGRKRTVIFQFEHWPSPLHAGSTGHWWLKDIN